MASGGGGSSQLIRSQSAASGAKMGLCSVCGAEYKLVESTGVLRKHGHSKGDTKGCSGSGRLPLDPTDVNTGCGGASIDSNLPSSSSASLQANHQPAFAPHCPVRPTLKRLPRGVRQRAATFFEERVRDVVNHPTDRNSWARLLEFGCCLGQPERGGKRQNLTKKVLDQIERGVSGVRATSPAAPSGRKKLPKASVSGGNQDSDAAKRASIKLDAGDIRGAVRALCSDEVIASPGPATLQSLVDKHPPTPANRRAIPAASVSPLTANSTDVSKAIRSFTPGSSGGPDGLRPQHLADMTGARIGGNLLGALTELVNLILAGGVPEWARTFFFGATLLAFTKKGGGVRPIAVGLTLRRLVSKVANSLVVNTCTSFLAPRQLGVGIKGGAEALAHAARQYLATMSPDQVFVKLDFSNAFNALRRDSMMEAVALHLPHLLPYVISAYGSSSSLRYEHGAIDSSEGIQQGDPLGPLLFCLTVNETIQSINSEFVSGYLDDIGIGGDVETVIRDIKRLEGSASELGLALNHSKCEVIGLTGQSRTAWLHSGLTFVDRHSSTASLLGTPIHAAGVDGAINERTEALKLAVPRLSLMSSHEALFLLKSSMAMPRLQYILRTAPCHQSPATTTFDDLVANTLSACLNVSLGATNRLQLSLPVRWGGIGVRSAAFLAPSAFLSSVTAAAPLLQCLLPARVLAVPDPLLADVLNSWSYCYGPTQLQPPMDALALTQRGWDEPRCAALSNFISDGSDSVGKARILAGCSTGSGSWLQALPSCSLGLRLSDDETRVAVGLRLGSDLVREHVCRCGSAVKVDGLHGLACRRSAGRHARHSMANEAIARTLRSLDIPVELEPVRLLRGDGKRPDGATLIPYSHGKCLVWDFTCPDTLAPSHLNQSCLAAGSAAAGAESRKRTKYSELERTYTFVPVAVETFGAWGVEALQFTAELGSRLAALTGETRSTSFLRQRLDIVIQRGNAAAIRGTFNSEAYADMD
jgi:Reverse transcriptase (RNA-dependent DNA polymerase)